MRGGVEAGLRLGVGKAEQESFYTAADNVVRKKLEVELQADENQERRDKREVQLPLLRANRAYAAGPVITPFCFKDIHICLVRVLSGIQTLSYALGLHLFLSKVVASGCQSESAKLLSLASVT